MGFYKWSILKKNSEKRVSIRRKLNASSYRFLKKGERLLPPVVRAVCGVLLFCGGLLGFLPILGFWMIPLGLALIASDVPLLRKRLIIRINASRRANR